MGCERYRRWVSDELDGELDAKRALRLAGHLQKCSSCRVYNQNLHHLQQESAGLGWPAPSPVYWDDFSARLRSRLGTKEQGKKQKALAQKHWRYAWAGVAALLITGLSLAIFLFLRPGGTAKETMLLSFEKFLDHVYQEIGSDYRLAEVFNLAVVDFLGEDIEAEGPSIRLYFPEDPLFVESLSEEEVEFISQEIEKETKFRGG